MSNQVNCIPGGEEYEDDSDYEEFVRPNRSKSEISQIVGGDVKIIPKLGFQAGLNKSDFDISLDTNADNW